ncbi:hypothetical protein [Paractinoplanes hotanensis]|uniref:Uncharacterized protein n=1 Tax=Paractinoplanes hotanensis TaxID=2906497 RepID=A0ABT0XV95_9ACTN|nr:hypothetical protein [Actinoplanes hotanensis]MCM4077721.1 hypothetical protein [Actinoplanes hotanensis]
MTAVRVHSYGKRPSIDDVPVLDFAQGPFDGLQNPGALVHHPSLRP